MRAASIFRQGQGNPGAFWILLDRVADWLPCRLMENHSSGCKVELVFGVSLDKIVRK